MRTTSMVLGLIGGAVCLALAFILVFAPTTIYSPDIPSYRVFYDNRIGLAVAAFLAAVLGIAGSLIVNKFSIVSGVLMILAAPLCLIGYLNIVSLTLFITGAVYALKKKRQSYPPEKYMPCPLLVRGQYMPPYPPYPDFHTLGDNPDPPTQPEK